MSIYSELKMENRFIYEKYGLTLGVEECNFLYIGDNLKSKEALNYADALINDLDIWWNK